MFSHCPFDPEILARCCVDFTAQSIHFNHNAQQAGGGWGGTWLLIDWQVFAYTVWDKMSAGALALTCKRLLAKQTDEGNLSCGGLWHGPLTLLLAASLTCHATVDLAMQQEGFATNKGACGKCQRGERYCCPHQHHDQWTSNLCGFSRLKSQTGEWRQDLLTWLMKCGCHSELQAFRNVSKVLAHKVHS